MVGKNSECQNLNISSFDPNGNSTLKKFISGKIPTPACIVLE